MNVHIKYIKIIHNAQSALDVIVIRGKNFLIEDFY